MNQKEALISAFEHLKQALIGGHAEELENMILDDYKGFTLNGTIEVKEDILAAFRPGGVNISKYEVADVLYEAFSEIGIVSGKGSIEGSFQEYTFQHEVLFIDIFKYVNGHWKYYKSQVSEIRSE
jgi:hypothetical protein